MKILEPSFEIQDDLDQKSLVVRLEACGRICYKSEELISEDSAMPFVRKVAGHGHNSVLEMAVVTLKVKCSRSEIDAFLACQPKYFVVDEYDGGLLLTASIRGFREIYQRFPDNTVVTETVGFLADRHPYLFEGIWKTSDGERRGSLEVEKMPLTAVEALPDRLLLRHRFVGVTLYVNRAVTHEIVRHRPCSYLQESQRYCRYSQDKFDNQVTFIKPMFYEEGSAEYDLWKKAMEETEAIYLKLLETSTPQAARTVLPNSCKTEIIVYCNLEEWKHIFTLRTHKTAEPSMREIMIPLAEELASRYRVF